MKPFDLKDALAGNPCVSKNGKIIYIFKDVREFGLNDDTPLVGIIIFNKNNYMLTHWRDDGKNFSSYDYQIVGMYEEPELTSEQVLEKAYQENLPLDAIGKKAFVIAKTKDGDYVMQCGEDNLYFASHEIEWKFYKDPAPKSDTITVTLPKPFKPKEGEVYYCIDLRQANGILETNYMDNCLADRLNSDNSQCFRTKSDAQAWLDAMKNALDD
ncbi:MAG: hypothetical protein ACFNT9_02615 [Rodentibacter sp.]